METEIAQNRSEEALRSICAKIRQTAALVRRIVSTAHLVNVSGIKTSLEVQIKEHNTAI